jgi:hypothetical protein
MLPSAGMGGVSDEDGMPDMLGAGGMSFGGGGLFSGRLGGGFGSNGSLNGGGFGGGSGGGDGGTAPPYMAMRDTDTSGSQSSFLPPGSFVRSTPLNHHHQHQQQAAAGGAGYSKLNGGLTQQQHSSVHAADLFGSPTWLNAQHPALMHLTPAAQQQHSFVQQHSQSYSQLAAPPAGYGPPPSSSHAAPNAGAGHARYASEDERNFDYGAHPYTQQQQQQQYAAAQAAAMQQQQQQQQQRTQLQEKRNPRM